MGKLEQHIETSEQSRLWRSSGEREFCNRILLVGKQLGTKATRKRLLAALGIGPVSFHSIQKGRCTYNLFFKQIAPAELARIHRGRQDEINGDDQVLTEQQWQQLDIIGLIRVYAPSLLPSTAARVDASEIPPKSASKVGLRPPPKGINEIFEVGHEMVEEVTPILIQACSEIVRCRFQFANRVRRTPLHSTASNQPLSLKPLQLAMETMPFPAGFVEATQTPKVLDCNDRLCDLFKVEKPEIVGKDLGNLISLAVRSTPAHLQGQMSELLRRRLGDRVTQGREKEPLCTQFYLDNRGRADSTIHRGCYKVTVIVFNLGSLGDFEPAHSFFAYHLKNVDAVP
jgi:PAS domain-containing protein